MVHITCGNKTPKIPQSGCSDCEQLEERVEALEQCCEDVHIALDDKADETEITEIMHIINGLAAGWHYIGDIEGVEDLPDSVSAGEAFYDITTGSWYIAKEDVPSGATINDFFFVSGNDYTLHTGTVDGDAVIRLTDTHGANSDIPVIGEGAVHVEDDEDSLVIGVDNATTEQAGLMSPEDKDKLDNIDDIYDETCGDPAEFEGQGGANLKSVQVPLEPHQAGTPWQDSTLYKTPFLFRKTPSVNHSINSKYTTLVGADVVTNQLCANGDFSSGTSGWTGNRGTITASNNKLTYTITDPAGSASIYRTIPKTIVGHKYLLLATITPSVNSAGAFYLGAVTGSITLTANKATTVYAIVTAATEETLFYVYPNRNSDMVASDTAVFENVQIIDLTAYYGSSAIADTAYTKEQTLAGSGIAWLKANGFDFSKYRAYNVGSLESVNPSAIKTVGFNQWDEEWEVGTIDYNTGESISASSMVRAKNYIPCLPSTTYYQTASSMNPSAIVTFFYDSEHNFIPYTGAGAYNNAFNGADGVFTTPSNARYLRFRTSSNYGATYKNDICINLHWDGSRDGEYEQYSEHEYDLGNVPLHGVFKEENGNIVAYGDVRTSDGTKTHNFGQVDLGTLTWVYDSSVPRFYALDLVNVIKRPQSATYPNRANVICPKYTITPFDGEQSLYSGVDKSCAIGTTGSVNIRDSAYTDAAAFKTAMSGVYLVYELATPTTDTADSFTNPQVVEEYGTEEFVTSNDVPVGNQTRYADVYEITGTDEVTVTVADDPDNPTTSDDYTTDLTQTVYEGTVDVVSGKAVLTMGSIESYNGETINEPWLSSLDPYVAGTTPTIGAQVVYTLDTPIEIDLTPTDIEALLGDNYVWSEQGRVCVTFMRDRGELSETLAELQECCDSCDSSECESDLVVFQHISADAYNEYPLDSLLPGDDVLYKITVNGVSKIIENAIYGDACMWTYRGDNNSELFFVYDEGWSVTTDAGEYDIKIETVCNQPLYVNLSASPLDSTQVIVMDKTYIEVEDAYKLGKAVIVRYSNYQHYTPLQVCYDPYTGFFVSIHGYDKATSTFDIFTFLAVLEDDYPTYSV